MTPDNRSAAASLGTVAVTGATGLVGTALQPELAANAKRVLALVRPSSKSKRTCATESATWDPATGKIDVATPIDAVVHLAGENIAGGRWNARRKQAIRDSRVQATRLLSEQLAARSPQPEVLVCASAIGYYGSRDDERLTEESLPGEGFLADLCRDWEAATAPAIEAGIRVVNLRSGVVLSRRGGALANMLTPFRLGAGGVIGSGQQYWSWVAIDDVVGAILHALQTKSVQGPVNVTAPQPATNREFTKALGQALHRPTIFPMPAFAARLLLGEMADDLLLASARVLPTRLQQTGYTFRYPELSAALTHVLA